MVDYDENRASGVTKKGNRMTELVVRLKKFMEQEARSCSMDFGCVTPIYVYRMWGGQVPLNEIEEALKFQDPRFMIQG